jgi:hypothetical protein
VRPIRDRLLEVADKPRNVRVTTEVDGESEHRHGYVVGVSRQILLLHSVENFHLDGYLAVCFRDISKVRIGKYERTVDRIMKHLGVHSLIGCPPWLRYGTWPSFFRSLKEAGKCVAVESRLANVNTFALGEVLEVGRESVSVREFSATAKWCTEPLSTGYKEISVAFFDDEYGRVFYEFMCTR